MSIDDDKDQHFFALVELFRPHVAAVKTPKMLAWARKPYSDEEKKVLLGFPLTPLLANALAAWRQEKTLLRGVVSMTRELTKALFSRPRLSEKQIDADLQRWINEAAAGFVRGWLIVLQGEARKSPTASLDSRQLDGAMLPSPHGGIDPPAMISVFDADQMSAAEIRGILRAVRATLPPGQPLPADAIEHLRLEGVKIVT